jgi:hypothetical protein
MGSKTLSTECAFASFTRQRKKTLKDMLSSYLYLEFFLCVDMLSSYLYLDSQGYVK